MNQLRAYAYAKINLALDVLSKREDGYHELDMIFQSISLCDQLDIKIGDCAGITLHCDTPGVPMDSKNLAYRAAECLLKAAGKSDYCLEITLTKNIPSEAGLAGGSADAAAVLVAANRLYDLGFTTDQLCEIGVKLGADVPFCIRGGTMRAKGIGEQMTPISPFPKLPIVVAKPKHGMNTAQAFSAIDSAEHLVHPQIDQIVSLLARGNVQEAGKYCGNVFMQITDVMDVFSYCRYFNDHGAMFSMMTGSGTAVFSVFANREQARLCTQGLLQAGESAFLCMPTDCGVQLISLEESV